MTAHSRHLLPSVSRVLEDPAIEALLEQHGRLLVLPAIRDAIDRQRAECDAGGPPRTRAALTESVIDDVAEQMDELAALTIHPVINGSGILLHTGLGRAPLAASARSALTRAAGSCLVEADPETGERIYRGFQVARQLQVLTGGADSLIVNNNAGATLLILQALCRDREVLISRGQLVEIGGSFRLPEIFRAAGVRLREVGTTNRTHLQDYEDALCAETAAIMRVHASNYRISGFTSEPSTGELAPLAQNHNLLLIDDIGSGQLQPVARLREFGEPTFANSLRAGADIVLGSGDKLLGGPQCGIIVGQRDLIGRLQQHPLARCLRIDKLTLAALQATLTLHLTDRRDEIPLFRMLSTTLDDLDARAEWLITQLGHMNVIASAVAVQSEVGGGTCAGHPIDSIALRIVSDRLPADELARRLRCGRPSVWSRTRDNAVLLDLRSIDPDQDQSLVLAVTAALGPVRRLL